MAVLTVQAIAETWKALQQAAEKCPQLLAQMPPEWYLIGSYSPYEHIPIERCPPGEQVQHKRIAWTMKPK
jgi:hypothetical protein